MSQVPPPFERSFSFTTFSTYTPNLQQPGNKIDQELNNVRTSLNATIDRLSEIQLDDGRLDSTSLNFNAIFTGLSTQLSVTYAALNSPALTGSPTAPTPSTSDNSTKIATTEFVKSLNYATQDQLASLQSSLSGYLTLNGGTLTGNLIVDAGEGSSGHFEPTEIFVTRNDATGTSANAYGALYNGGVEVGDSSGNYAELTPAHLRFGDGTIQTTAATAGAFLPLAGGTLTGNLIVNTGSGSYAQVDPTEIFTQQTNAGAGQSNAYGYLYNGGIEIGDTAGKWAELTTTHLRFGDGTTQTTAATAGAFLPLSGGTMSGTIFLPSLRNLLNTNLTVTAYNDTGAGTNFVHTFDAYDGTFALATNGGGLKFPDATVQVTSALPLTGGTITGDIYLNARLYVGNDPNYDTLWIGNDFIDLQANTVRLDSNGISLTGGNGFITFADSTVQTTAFIPENYLSTSAAYSTFLPLTGGTMSSSNINGIVDANTWSFGYNGLSGYNDVSSTLFNFNANSIYATSNNGYDTFTLNPSGVSGTVGDDPAQAWSFGVNGLTFSDSTVQTTAFTGNYLPLTGGTLTGNLTIAGSGNGITFPDSSVQTTAGITIDPAEGGINIQATATYGGFRVYRTRNDGDGDYTAIGQMNTYGFNFVSEGNPNGDYSFGFGNGVLNFQDLTVQSTAGIPEAPIDGNAYVRKNGAWVNINDL